jgi:tetratricopeptide (TPR) repeat protein
LRYDPGYRDSLFLLGFAHQKAGLRDRAIEEYGRFLRARPNHFQAQFNLAYALMKNGDCDAAVPRFIRVLELRPGYTETHQHLATCYRALGEPAKAGEHAAIHDRARRKPTGP